MPLHSERNGTGARLVLVHGFTQTGRCWGPIAPDLERDHEVVRVDAPGHGGSADIEAGLRDGAGLIGDAGGLATYVGYSMGARFCLHLALAQPSRVRGLVLIGGTAGIEDPAERAVRREQDLRTAQRIAAEGLDAFLDGWLDQPIFATLPSGAACREERLTNTVRGLQSSLVRAGTGSQEPLWDQLPGLSMPVLVVAGRRDAKFAALGERMASAIGTNATLALVPDAGHTAHLEQPDALLSILRPWLAAHEL